ncbi:snRNA-activating protein complex subunit 1-like [Daphnia carinata]|uniref:snRNA-activating protein complex subunit 1-like n=1 Tax=Daphnia carinata TaxID=120202 RepID=UPI00257E23FE|nr:snRNA-activating protein complex subunit 1-like [Daphnia carinata]
MPDSLSLFHEKWIQYCHQLINNFSNTTSNTNLSFRDFENHWKCVNLKLMFCKHSIEELCTLVSELFNVGKYFLLLQQPLASRVGGLYLLFALYFTQRTRNRIRLTLNELKALIAFLDELKKRNMSEQQFIFYKLFLKKAFVFASTPNQFVNQTRQSKEDADIIGNLLDSCKCGLLQSHGLSVDELDNLDKRLNKYQEIKSQIPGFCNSYCKPAATDGFVSEYQ